MDPFALQDEARRNTTRLVCLGVAAVTAVVLSAAVVFAFGAWAVFSFVIKEELLDFSSFLAEPFVVAFSLFMSTLVVLVGFLIKLSDISSPERLMTSVGAKRVRRLRFAGGDPRSDAVQRLLNVCEEMAIASGVVMPSVWLLENSSDVNAFVAGNSPSNAALCVTEGALRYLERDELQGMVAHEFGHILNGDMRLNFRLLMLVAGVTAYNRIGKGMLGVFSGDDEEDGGRRSRGFVALPRGGKGGKGGGAVLVFIAVYIATAVLLWLIGSIGVFFARLVQCAVSRQREYLADASAAQFTRNPEALANALRLTYLVAGGAGGSPFAAWKADVAHMLFTEGDRRLFATHPPVRDRIDRLSPAGIYADEELTARIRRIREDRKNKYERSIEEGRNRRRAAASSVKLASLGVWDPSLRAIPPAFAARLRTPGGAGTALVEILRGRQPKEFNEPLTRAQKRQLASRCAMAIRDTETDSSRRKWVETLTEIAKEDGEIDSFEFILLAAMRRYLGEYRPLRTVAASRVTATVARVVSTVAGFGSDAETGYRAAEKMFSLIRTPLPPRPAPYDNALDFLDGLDELVNMPPLAKRELLFGLQATISQDGFVSDVEADYVSAVADAIAAYGWSSARTS